MSDELLREHIIKIIKQFEAASPDAGYGYEAEEMSDQILKLIEEAGYVKLTDLLEFISGYTKTRTRQNPQYNEPEGLSRLHSVLKSRCWLTKNE